MGSVICIGNFDGVHVGHRALFAEVVRSANAKNLTARLLTFAPHPAIVLGREAPAVLTDQARKRALAAREAPDLVFCEQRFDAAFAAQTPAEFAAFLVEHFALREVYVGANFRFGRQRSGTFADLVTLGERLGFQAKSVVLVEHNGAPVSSSRIRAFLAEGRVTEAAELLGRPHAIVGTVGRGKQLGRTLGFPTANLHDILEAPIGPGIYAVWVERRLGESWQWLGEGALSVGTNPSTDADERVKHEVFILDFSGDLYGEQLRLHVAHELRREQRFDSLEALSAQISADVAEVRVRLGGAELPEMPKRAGAGIVGSHHDESGLGCPDGSKGPFGT